MILDLLLVLDAIVVGMDMLIKKFGVSDKGKKRLYLITDARFSTKEPYEGTKEDQVDTISQQMKVLGIRLNCLIIREKICSTEHLGAIDENDKLLDQFSRKAMAKTVHVDCATSLLGAIKTRNVVPVTVFRGDLELSSMMKIKVRSRYYLISMNRLIMTICLSVIFYGFVIRRDN